MPQMVTLRTSETEVPALAASEVEPNRGDAIKVFEERGDVTAIGLVLVGPRVEVEAVVVLRIVTRVESVNRDCSVCGGVWRDDHVGLVRGPKGSASKT